MRNMEVVCLTRSNSGLAWGFRLQGGLDFAQKLAVQRVTPGSPASTACLRVGDIVIRIGEELTENLTHQQALDRIRLCGDRLLLSIARSDSPLDPRLLKRSQSDCPSKSFADTLEKPAYSTPLQRGNSYPLRDPLAISDSSRKERLAIMAWNGNPKQDHIPDQLLSQFNKKTDDKPFSYLPSGGIAELQQRQKAPPVPVKPKPINTERQTSYSSSGRSSPGLQRRLSTPSDPDSLFTPAYREYIKKQQEQYVQSHGELPPPEVGIGPGKVNPEEVAAYILQPDGTMLGIRLDGNGTRLNDQGVPDLRNSAVMAALMEEQEAQQRGRTTGRIQSASGSRQGLSFKVLQWLTGTDSEDNSENTSNISYPGSRGSAPSPPSRQSRQTSMDMTNYNPNSQEQSEVPKRQLKVVGRSASQNGEPPKEIPYSDF